MHHPHFLDVLLSIPDNHTSVQHFSTFLDIYVPKPTHVYEKHPSVIAEQRGVHYNLLTKSRLQNAFDDIRIFFFKHMHFWLISLISHNPIAGDFGAIALFVGSYQFLQNAHLFIVLILTIAFIIVLLSLMNRI